MKSDRTTGHLQGGVEVVEAAFTCALLVRHARIQRLTLRRHRAQPLLLLHPVRLHTVALCCPCRAEFVKGVESLSLLTIVMSPAW